MCISYLRQLQGSKLLIVFEYQTIFGGFSADKIRRRIRLAVPTDWSSDETYAGLLDIVWRSLEYHPHGLHNSHLFRGEAFDIIPAYRFYDPFIHTADVIMSTRQCFFVITTITNCNSNNDRCKKTFSLIQSVTATPPTSHNWSSKNKKVLLLMSTLTLWRCAAKVITSLWFLLF